MTGLKRYTAKKINFWVPFQVSKNFTYPKKYAMMLNAPTRSNHHKPNLPTKPN